MGTHPARLRIAMSGQAQTELALVMAVVMAVMVVGKGLSRYGRDCKDGDSGKGQHQVAKFHMESVPLSTRFSCRRSGAA